MLKDILELVFVLMALTGIALWFGVPAALIVAGVAGVVACEVR